MFIVYVCVCGAKHMCIYLMVQGAVVHEFIQCCINAIEAGIAVHAHVCVSVHTTIY